MNRFDLLIIAPGDTRTVEGDRHVYETPYGAVSARLHPLGARWAAWATADNSPFAAIYAAKAAGATRVIELAPVVARNRLLEPGDLLLPDDLVDCTQYPRYTFFAHKGYGFLAQREPFCPALRGALRAAASAQVGRVFARGVYLAAESLCGGGPDPIWDADVVGGGVVPASFLARELELCYAPICVVGDRIMTEMLTVVLADALRNLPAERGCPCATAMRQYRDRGEIGPDWRTWIAV